MTSKLQPDRLIKGNKRMLQGKLTVLSSCEVYIMLEHCPVIARKLRPIPLTWTCRLILPDWLPAVPGIWRRRRTGGLVKVSGESFITQRPSLCGSVPRVDLFLPLVNIFDASNVLGDRVIDDEPLGRHCSFCPVGIQIKDGLQC